MSKQHFIKYEHSNKARKYYDGITMKLDHTNNLFISMGGMLFTEMEINVTAKKNIKVRSKVTNGSSCILHGNGPGVILWRSYIKQIVNHGILYVDDYVLRGGHDVFLGLLWWTVGPIESLVHWGSVTYHIDWGIKIHSTAFSEDVIWKFHVWTFIAIIFIFALSLGYWYKYLFSKNRKKYIKNEDEIDFINDHIHLNSSTKRKNKSFSFDINTNILNNNNPITQKFVDRLNNLEVIVTNNGNIKLKTQKKN